MPSSAFFIGIWNISLMFMKFISFEDGGRKEAKK